ncbi:MAG: YabP/YqfC family sporulation protein [Clostridia bacterium]|nr:YabP/YqfC family sporulation protein [Clostridia bacterium]
MKKSRKDKINQFLDIPKEIGSNVPKITIVGFEELLIENYKGIIEYEEFFVRISTHIGNISINGFELNLNEMTEDDILVTGKIESVDFEER